MVVVMAILLCLSLLPAVHAAEEVATGDMTVYALRDYWSTLPDGTPAYVGALVVEAVEAEGYEPSDDGDEEIPIVDERVTYHVLVALVKGCDAEAARAEILSQLSSEHRVRFTESIHSLRELEEVAAYITATYGKEARVTGADTVEVVLGMSGEETEATVTRLVEDAIIPVTVDLRVIVWDEEIEDGVPEDEIIDVELDVVELADDRTPYLMLGVLLMLLAVSGAVFVSVRRRKAVLQTAAGVNVLQEHGEGERLSRAAVRQRLASEGQTPDESVDARIRGEIE
ncbi:MAG: hypothetical protein IJW97_00415 [Clostridia bacterium]|nr:hypothetical protein [Clostridia bacterium]